MDYTILLKIDFIQKGNPLYKDKIIEIRKVGKHIRFYEIDKATGNAVCIKKETVLWLRKNKKLNTIDLYV